MTFILDRISMLTAIHISDSTILTCPMRTDVSCTSNSIFGFVSGLSLMTFPQLHCEPRSCIHLCSFPESIISPDSRAQICYLETHRISNVNQSQDPRKCSKLYVHAFFLQPTMRLHCVLGQGISDIPTGITHSLLRVETRPSSEGKSMDRPVIPTNRGTQISRAEIRHTSFTHLACHVRAQ